MYFIFSKAISHTKSSDPPIAVCYIRSIDGELATFVLAKMRQPEQYADPGGGGARGPPPKKKKEREREGKEGKGKAERKERKKRKKKTIGEKKDIGGETKGPCLRGPCPPLPPPQEKERRKEKGKRRAKGNKNSNLVYF